MKRLFVMLLLLFSVFPFLAFSANKSGEEWVVYEIKHGTEKSFSLEVGLVNKTLIEHESKKRSHTLPFQLTVSVDIKHPYGIHGFPARDEAVLLDKFEDKLGATLATAGKFKYVGRSVYGGVRSIYYNVESEQQAAAALLKFKKRASYKFIESFKHGPNWAWLKEKFNF